MEFLLLCKLSMHNHLNMLSCAVMNFITYSDKQCVQLYSCLCHWNPRDILSFDLSIITSRMMLAFSCLFCIISKGFVHCLKCLLRNKMFLTLWLLKSFLPFSEAFQAPPNVWMSVCSCFCQLLDEATLMTIGLGTNLLV